MISCNGYQTVLLIRQHPSYYLLHGTVSRNDFALSDTASVHGRHRRIYCKSLQPAGLLSSISAVVHILYVDGVLIEDRGGNDVGVDTDIVTNDVEIGYDQWIEHGNYAEGTMDEVAIFNVALSGADINDIMNQGLADVLLSVEPGGKLATTWSSLKSGN